MSARGAVTCLRAKRALGLQLSLLLALFWLSSGNDIMKKARFPVLRPHPFKRTFVAIILCIKSVDTWSSVGETSLKTLFLPSLASTILPAEREIFNVEVILAFDKGDLFWEQRANREAVIAGENIPISFVSVLKERDNHIPFNELAAVAYSYGADYLVRVNDDTEFVSRSWISHSVRTLSYLSPPLLGVVGPVCDKSPPNILTHDMVHSTHLEIFSTYYPNEFDNWWIDDWISAVYGRNRTIQVPEWKVKHHINKHGTRYQHNDVLKTMLPALVTSGKKRIVSHLKSLAAQGPQPKTRVSPCLMRSLGIHEGPLQSFVRCK